MIIIRNAIKEDVSIIEKFNSAMALETVNKQLDSVAVHKGVEELLKKRELGFYPIAESDGVPVRQLMLTKD